MIRSRAFTLIELLTVIAIIGILAAILIPVVGKVREQARAAVCSSNIRQVSLAILLFADENNGVFPTTGSTHQREQTTDWIFWRDGGDRIRKSSIVPYLGNAFTPDIYRCPSDERLADRLHELGHGNDSFYAFSFTMNRALDPDPRVHNNARRPNIRGQIDMIHNPSRIIMLAEEHTPNDSSAWLEHSQDELALRHSNLAHVSFVDGSVKRVTRQFAKEQGNWDPLYVPFVYKKPPPRP